MNICEKCNNLITKISVATQTLVNEPKYVAAISLEGEMSRATEILNPDWLRVKNSLASWTEGLRVHIRDDH